MTSPSSLHITHVQGIFSPEHGGPSYSLTNYVKGQVARGHRASVRVLEGFPHTSAAIRLSAPVDMKACAVGFPSRLGVSAALRETLQRDDTPDVYHLHGVWLRAMHYGAVEARRRRRPYVVELMGAYETWARRQKRLTKWVARKWYQDALLERATCLHVNSPKEAQDLRELGFRAPVAIIPVGVDTSVSAGREDDQKEAVTFASAPQIGRRPFVLYLARIHSKKGIELLLKAWAGMERRFSDWQLVVAGAGDPAYVEQCRRLIESLGLGERCQWVGQVDEAQKAWLYQHAGYYVLPSYSENFGNTVAEALAYGTPVITTPHTVWTHLPAEGCGWLAETEVDSLREALGKALDTSPAERQRMGDAGRALVERRYSLTSVVDQIDRVYRWMLGSGERPDDILV